MNRSHRKKSKSKHRAQMVSAAPAQASKTATTLRFYLLPPPPPKATANNKLDKSCYCDATVGKHGDASIDITLANHPQIPRTRYMHVIGAALKHLIKHFEAAAPQKSVRLSCSSKLLPLNAVVAVGCLGFKVNTINKSTIEIHLKAKNKLRQEPTFFDTKTKKSSSKTSSSEPSISAQAWQFRSAWDESNQCFRSSYYQLSSGTFAWCRPCSTPLVAEITALKQRDRTWHPDRLNEQTWEKLMTAPPQTPVYLESMNRGAVFFGVAGDVQAKAMWLNTLPLPKTQLLNLCRSRAYFADPRDAPALALELNNKLGASVAATSDFVDVASSFGAAEPDRQFDDVDNVWTGAHLELLPLQALANLKHMWTLEHFVNLNKLSSNAAFTAHVLQGVPVGARHLVAPLLNSKDHAVPAAVSKNMCTIRACAVSLAICPSLLESWTTSSASQATTLTQEKRSP